jgi:hypothetical protein
VQGLTDRSRRPYRYANQLPFQVENYILNVKREHAGWGARKIREQLIGRSPAYRFLPRAPSMRCWIVMAWSSARPLAPSRSGNRSILRSYSQ